MGDTTPTPPPTDGAAQGSRAPGAPTAFLPIGVVFLVIGLTQLREGAGAVFLVLGIVFLGMSAGGGYAATRASGRPDEAGRGDPEAPRS